MSCLEEGRESVNFGEIFKFGLFQFLKVLMTRDIGIKNGQKRQKTQNPICG
jgi:hypothetical protein